MVLFRPVGPRELELIRDSGWKKFPPRLPEQPIFYPVIQEAYAARIAKEWNVRDSGSGYVTRFSVDDSYIGKFESHVAAGQYCTEYWIPAEQLDEFNSHLTSTIEVIRSYP